MTSPRDGFARDLNWVLAAALILTVAGVAAASLAISGALHGIGL